MTHDDRPTPPAPIGAEDLLAQRPAALGQPDRVALAPRSRPTVTMVLAGVVGAAVLFAGGLLVGHSSASAASSSTAQAGVGAAAGARAGGGFGAGGAGGAAARGGFTAGQIASIDGSTITITKSDGSTAKVTTSSSTTVSQTAQADVSALKVGDPVTVIGPTAADSSVTATAITEGATGFGGAGGGARGGAGAQN
jgi:hypothetical protein